MFASTRRISDRALRNMMPVVVAGGLVAGAGGCGGAALTIELFLNPVDGVDYASMTALNVRTRVDADDGDEGRVENTPFERNDARKQILEVKAVPDGELLIRVSGCPGEAALCGRETERFVGCATEHVSASATTLPIEISLFNKADAAAGCDDVLP